MRSMPNDERRSPTECRVREPDGITTVDPSEKSLCRVLRPLRRRTFGTEVHRDDDCSELVDGARDMAAHSPEIARIGSRRVGVEAENTNRVARDERNRRR